MSRLRRVPWLVGVLSVVLLAAVCAQAGTAKPQPGKVKRTALPVWALAMDGPRVAYMRSDRRVGVWNVATGATSPVKGDYPRKGHSFGYGTGEVAIAGKRVALITRFVIGNSYQTQERLYTGSLGGSVHQLGKLTNHSTDPPICEIGDYGFSSGNWVAGVVGSGKILAVSTWQATGQSVPSHERLSLVTSSGLRTIATGPGAIVAAAASGGHIAVLRSTQAWPPLGEVGSTDTAPSVGVYSGTGELLGEIPLSITLNGCGYPNTIVQVALSGKQVVVLTETMPQAGSLTADLEVYDWTTGALLQTWPVALGSTSPGLNRLAVYGRLAAVEGRSELDVVDLTTGKQVRVGPSSRIGCPPAIDSRGLVYVVNPGNPTTGSGKLVFVPMARLLTLLP